MKAHLDPAQLRSYVQGTAPPNRLREIDAHLGACAECRRRMRAALARSGAPLPSPESLLVFLQEDQEEHPGVERLLDFVFGALSPEEPEEIEEIERHLQHCAICRQEAEDIRKGYAGFSSLPFPPVPEAPFFTPDDLREFIGEIVRRELRTEMTAFEQGGERILRRIYAGVGDAGPAQSARLFQFVAESPAVLEFVPLIAGTFRTVKDAESAPASRRPQALANAWRRHLTEAGMSGERADSIVAHFVDDLRRRLERENGTAL